MAVDVALVLAPVVVGVVVVGFGTGVPELLVSGSAAARGSLDLAVGNVVGSNLANLTLVLGIGGMLARPGSHPRNDPGRCRSRAGTRPGGRGPRSGGR